MEAAVAPHAARRLHHADGGRRRRGRRRDSRRHASRGAASDLARISVNNGGDIALWLAPGRSDDGRPRQPARPPGAVRPRAARRGGRDRRDRDVAARRGAASRSASRTPSRFSRAGAAEADAAATVVANAVDLPGDPRVERAPGPQPPARQRSRRPAGDARGLRRSIPNRSQLRSTAASRRPARSSRAARSPPPRSHLQGVTRTVSRDGRLMALEAAQAGTREPVDA